MTTPCKDCSKFLLKETIVNVYAGQLGSTPRDMYLYMCLCIGSSKRYNKIK